MHLIPVIVFALAVSADGLGVGLAYGMKRIRVPISSLLVICLASMLAVAVSMLVGQGIAAYFSPFLAKKIGAGALMAVGLWFVCDWFRQQGESTAGDEEVTIASLRIKPLGIIIRILREPSTADFDASGVISCREAFLLGLALALDALGAGIGASMTGFDMVHTVIMVGVCKCILLSSGLKLGARLSHGIAKGYAALVSGLILCLLGASAFW